MAAIIGYLVSLPDYHILLLPLTNTNTILGVHPALLPEQCRQVKIVLLQVYQPTLPLVLVR